MSKPRKEPRAARLAAKAAGATRYFEPTPCIRGHVTDRYVSNNGCTGCHREQRGAIYIGQRVDVSRWNNIRLARRGALRRLSDLKKKIDSLSKTYEASYESLSTMIKTISEEI